MEWLWGYGIGVSVVAVVTTVYDKWAAQHDRRRIAERTLFSIAIAGGATAMYVTMQVIRHKTKHKRFMIGLPLVFVLQFWLLFRLMNGFG